MALASVAMAQAATYTVHDTLASWQAAATAPVLSQTFQGYSDGQLMTDQAFLPGVSGSTNVGALRVYQNFEGAKFLFGFGARGTGDARYDFALTEAYGGVAFDIVSFEADPANASSAAGPGALTVFFADASSVTLPVAGNAAGSPVFFGITASSAISAVRWAEPLEINGLGNEETGIDNFRVAAVPEPATLGLWLLGLGGLALRLRRR